mmetsp:Transcript_39423/g.46056  ORF Transcript_39423/g.46056 Transcript_39423/m.46056 type:complete len:120 (+) Transcript_39423:88-447(+)
MKCLCDNSDLGSDSTKLRPSFALEIRRGIVMTCGVVLSVLVVLVGKREGVISHGGKVTSHNTYVKGRWTGVDFQTSRIFDRILGTNDDTVNLKIRNDQCRCDKIVILLGMGNGLMYLMV